MTNKQIRVIEWCRRPDRFKNQDHMKMCCYCFRKEIYHQEGDGKHIHTLCRKCNKELKQKIKELGRK